MTNEWPNGPESRGIHISLLIDSSSSMRGPRHDVLIPALNGYYSKLKESLDDYTITLAYYNTDSSWNPKYTIVHGAVPLSKIPKMEHKDFEPFGYTPTRDSLARITDETRIFAEKQNPSRCLVVLITDGDDNESRKYTIDMTTALINKLESPIFGFMALMIGNDAMHLHEAIGVPLGSIIEANNATLDGAIQKAARTTMSYAMTGQTTIAS